MNWCLIRVLLMLLPACSIAETPLLDGKAVFAHSCAPCHSEGPFMAGTKQLEANYHGSKPALLEERTDLTPEFVKAIVRRGVNVMPRFRKTEVSDAELNALAMYLSRNASTVPSKPQT